MSWYREATKDIIVGSLFEFSRNGQGVVDISPDTAMAQADAILAALDKFGWKVVPVKPETE